MSYRQTGIGIMFDRDPFAAQAEILSAIESCDGNLVRAAHLLAVSRRHLYRLVYRAQLWADVDKARAAAEQRLVEAQRAIFGEHQ